jgi:hypothetical protein
MVADSSQALSDIISRFNDLLAQFMALVGNK